MQYMLAIYEDHTAYADEQALADIIRAHGAYSEMLAKAGVIRGGEGLVPPEQAKTVRRASGRSAVHDGPYAEMQEQLGGFYIIETETMEDALDWAAKMPLVGDGSVEVRPCIGRSPA
ncbi:MAG: YciI family protein [Pseudomonadota bacterium]